MRLLLVEDDQTIASGLAYSLEQEGFEVTVCPDQRSALEAAEKPFDLALLDLALPDGSGYEVFQGIRRDKLPVIFLTASDDEVNVVRALDMGADDYITKPFRIRELVSRIRTVLRRCGRAEEENGALQVGDLKIQTAQAKVYKAGREVPLTALEYRLLLAFAARPGQVFTRSQLLECIWDVAGDFVNDNTLTVYIKRLREKLEEDPQNPRCIVTVRGMGYKLEK